MPMRIETLERLFAVAETDTGQGCRVANFLLAWWNAGSCGGFDLADLWNVDLAIARDLQVLFAAIGADAYRAYPDGFENRFRELVLRHRPELELSEPDEAAA